MTSDKKLPLMNFGQAPAASVACGQCHYLTQCGGLDETQPSLWGCFTKCRDGLCGTYDWTCPCRMPEFVRRWSEVGGVRQRPVGELMACTAPKLPLYMPMVVTHGLKTVRTVPVDTAAITTYELIRGRQGVRRARAKDPSELRRALKLPLTSRILLVSVANDIQLATWWATRKKNELPTQLAQLGIMGVTVPNFSFFTDAPRTHTLWNRARMMRCAEEFSAAGLGVILHLNAQTTADWTFWADILREQPLHRYVVKEFQTGLLNPGKARQALNDLARLQDGVGRELHPLLIGGARLVEQAPRYFRSFTIIDSRPWMTTIKRQQAVLVDGELKWHSHPTEQGESLDLLLAHNLDVYRESIQERAKGAKARLVMSSDSRPLNDNDAASLSA